LPFTAPSRSASTDTGSTSTSTNISTSTSTTASDPSVGTRRALSAKRRRTRRIRSLTIAGAAATALVAGTGFALAHAAGAPDAFGIPSAGASGSSTGALPSDVRVTHSADGRISVYTAGVVTRADANSEAKAALATGHLVADGAKGKTDAAALTTSIAHLADYRSLDTDTVMQRVAATQTAAQQVGAKTLVANARIAAVKAAAARAAAAAAQARADAARQAAANTPAAAKATAQSLMASQYGWGSDQFACLANLWNKESGWNYRAYNASGATGIPQALPGSKMAIVASDWSTNATTQIIWGLGYIKGSYGTPCAAWAHSEANNWY
jgi:hypothetical protein